MANNDKRKQIDITFFEDKKGRATKSKEDYSRKEIQMFLESESKGDKVLEDIVKLMKNLNPRSSGDVGEWKMGDGYRIAKDDSERLLYPDQIISRQMPIHKSNKGVPQVEKKPFTTQPYNSKELKPYWNLWSLLGLFLSLKYKAHPNCTKKDFFARLTALYGWWCRGLVPGETAYPAVCQCTWGRTKDSSLKRKGRTKESPYDLFLGHSFAGAKPGNFPSGDEKNHPWLTAVKQQRYNLLANIVARDEGNRWNFNYSPNRDPTKDGRLGTRFGNCGETYPFLALADPQSSKTPKGYYTLGVALRWDYWEEKPPKPPIVTGKAYDDVRAKENYMSPCDNCYELLRLCGDTNMEDRKLRYTSEGGWDDGTQKDGAGRPVVIRI